MTTKNVTAENVSAEKLNADSIRTAISRTDTAFAQRLVVDGDAVITGNLKVNGSLTGITSFDSLHILNKIKVGNSINIDNYNGSLPGYHNNHIYTTSTGATDDPTLYLQSNWAPDPITNPTAPNNYNTIINFDNYGKVGIGTNNPLEKLDVSGTGRFGNTEGYVKIGFNTVHGIIDSDHDLLINYYNGKDVVIGKINVDHTANGSLIVSNNLGIGTNASISSALKLHIKGYTCTGPLCGTPIEDGNEEASTIMRIEDEVYGQTNRDVWWDFIVSGVNQKLYINSQSGSTLNRIITMTETGNVGIGTINPEYKLDVCGTIRATEVKVDLLGCDFVFEDNYTLLPLKERKSIVLKQKHLLNVASALEMQEGAPLGKTMIGILQNVEEHEQYLYQQDERIEKLEQTVELLVKENLEKNTQIEQLKTEIQNLKK